MEIVAMDMKVSCMYIARQLSFSGVTFRIEEIPLSPAFEQVYNRAARLVSWGSGLQGPRSSLMCITQSRCGVCGRERKLQGSCQPRQHQAT